MKLVLAADDDHPLVDEVERVVRTAGHDIVRLDKSAWPTAGHEVGTRVARGEFDAGIAACWTGTGVSIAANKVPGVRAALCGDATIADGARRWNDANVLALSMRSTSVPMVAEIVEAFLSGDVDPDEQHNIDLVETSD